MGPWAHPAGPLASTPRSQVREPEGGCLVAGSLGELAHPPLCIQAKRREDPITSNLPSCCHCSRESFPGTGMGLAAEGPGQPAQVSTRTVFEPSPHLPVLCQTDGKRTWRSFSAGCLLSAARRCSGNAGLQDEPEGSQHSTVCRRPGSLNALHRRGQARATP